MYKRKGNEFLKIKKC